MNQLPQRAIVESEAVGRVEVPGAGAAQRAAAFQIERKSILERSLTLGAEVFGGMSYRRVEAIRANRNASISAQGLITDAAFIGEEDRKKSARNLK
jgi:hypothetical protein